MLDIPLATSRTAPPAEHGAVWLDDVDRRGSTFNPSLLAWVKAADNAVLF